MKKSLLIAIILIAFSAAEGQRRAVNWPARYWTLEQSQAIIDKTQTTRLAPDISGLSAGERAALEKLNEVGEIFQKIYAKQRYPDAFSSLEALNRLDKRLGSIAATQNLLTLYRLNQGPVATTLENKREPFLPVRVQPGGGGGMYPADATKAELDAFLAANPEKKDEILGQRTLVRRATALNLQTDLATLGKYPVLDALHPNLKNQLQNTRPNSRSFYAVPYSVAYSDELLKTHALLNQAADAIEKDDAEFAGYLRNRSLDLLSDNYESGDAAWVTANFKNLNGQIGAYETYDDPLYGVKTFFSLNVLKTRQPETANLRKALKGLQTLENSLPDGDHKKVKEDISVGVYDVVTDFAQSRGGNTATILPNESLFARRYGRTILIRANILQNPEIFEASLKGFQTAVSPENASDLTSEGNFYYTLWHEVGHYLGVDRTRNGREIHAALQENSDIYEEMKADLVSLYVAEALQKSGYYTKEQLRSVYAAGIRRVLQNNKPRRSQPYNTMQLMQWNFFLENGLLAYDPKSERMTINYDKYHEVVGKLLAKVFEIQFDGDKSASDQFIDQYTAWNENLHGAIAKNIRAQQRYRFRLFKYAALGE